MARQGRRRFGWVRKLPSGRFQASYLGDDGQRRYAPDTSEREGEASDWLTLRESEILRAGGFDSSGLRAGGQHAPAVPSAHLRGRVHRTPVG